MTTEDFVHEAMVAFRKPPLEWGGAYERGIQFALEHPDAIAEVAVAFIDASIDTRTYLNDILAFLPMHHWPPLVEAAVRALSTQPRNEAARDVIDKAALQVPTAVHPYLAQLYALETRDPAVGYVVREAFREATLADVRDILDDCEEKEAHACHLVYRALLETRRPDAFDIVRRRDAATFTSYLPEVGFEETAAGYRQLYPTRVLHLSYGGAERAAMGTIAGGTNWHLLHPTWTRADPHAPSYHFGGSALIDCGVCGRPAHRLLTLRPIPDGSGVTGLEALDLVTCLSCLGYTRPSLAYRHDVRGQVHDLNHTGAYTPPEYPADPFRAFDVSPVDLGARWRWQEWAAANARENLHRIGGHPSWIDDAAYPTCPNCNQTMTFLLQLDSGCDADDWLWGSGGICYTFWCDDCKISCMFWQCT